MILALLITNSVYSNILEQRIKISYSTSSTLRDDLTNIIVQTGVSVIQIDDKPVDECRILFKEPVNLKLCDFCNLLAGDQYQWHLSSNNVLIFRKRNISVPALELKMQPEYCISSPVITESLPIFHYLMTKNLILIGILAEKINYSPFLKEESFGDYLTRVVENTNTLTVIYKISDQDATILWDIFLKKNPNLKKASGDLFGLLISQNYEPQKKIVFCGEDIADGSSLVFCKLKLTEKQKFELTVKNTSNQTLKFSNFKTQNVVINDVASDGKFFEVNELGMFLIFPPLDSALPEEFTLEPHEEKVFTFPLIGARSKENKGKPIWNIGVEKEYDYKPDKDCTILTSRNKKYNLYGIVVYFYDETGKKYKAFNKDLINSTGWPEQ